jgi:signal transduction histidine kinase
LTPSRRLVLAAFTVVGLVVAIFTSLAFFQVRALEVRARELVDNMLTSVRLLGQLENQVQRQETLLDEHILAKEPAEMAGLEAKLAALQAEIEETSRTYWSWVTLPGERAGWDKTRADLMAIREPVARALTLSRENRDTEARQEMQLVAEQFATVGRDFDQLISINDRAAAESMERYSRIQLRLVLTLIAIGVVVLAGTVVVGRWAARQVGRREQVTALEAQSLEERNRELDAFAGRVAHDIRNPLMAINMAARQLEGKVPEGTRATEALRRGVQRMEMLVDDLLALARVEKLTRAVCDPAAVAAQVREDFAARFDGESGNLRVAVAPAAVSCSEGLLRQALTNLAENAVKYCRPGVTPEVEISGVRVDGGYDLRVSDNGLGMTPDEAGHVFEPFYRSPRTRDLPGTGLGLSIVNRVAHASGGTLSLETHVGEGSTFTLHLPLADSSTEAQT